MPDEAATEENYTQFAAEVMQLSEDEIITAIVRLDADAITRIKNRVVDIIKARTAMAEIELAIENKKRELEYRREEYERLTQLGNPKLPDYGALAVGVDMGGIPVGSMVTADMLDAVIGINPNPYKISEAALRDMYRHWEDEQKKAGMFLPAPDLRATR